MADKLTLPKAKLPLDLHAAPVEPTMKAAEASAGKVYRVPVDKIMVIPGFNLRVETPDYIEHRDSIRASIAANGFNPKKPLSGYVAEEDGKNVIYVTDGHTRLSAVREYNADPDTAEKDEITHLPVIVAPKETTLADLLVELHTANSGRKLTPFEHGVLSKRLLGEGLTKADIAARLGFTTRYIDDVLLLASADAKVKQHVAAGDVSSTMAIQMLRKDADTAGERIEEVVKKAAQAGKKATKKMAGPKTQKIKVAFEFTNGQDMKEIVKQAAAAIREAVPAEDDGETKGSTVSGSVSLTIEIPVADELEPAKETAAKKAPAKKAKAKAAAEDAETEGEKAVKRRQRSAKGGAAKTAKAKKAKADLGIDGAAPVDDDEIAVLPPKVESDEGVPDDEVDI